MNAPLSRSHQQLRRALALAYLVAVFTAGTIDLGPLPLDKELPIDKVGHLVMFGALVWVMEIALLELGTKRRRLWAVGSSVTAGLVLELVQAALPHRYGDVLDFIADCLGALLALGISILVVRSSARRASVRAARGV